MSSSTSSPEAEAETRFMESLNGEEREEGGEGESKPLITGEVDHENEGSEEGSVVLWYLWYKVEEELTEVFW